MIFMFYLAFIDFKKTFDNVNGEKRIGDTGKEGLSASTL